MAEEVLYNLHVTVAGAECGSSLTLGVNTKP